MFCRNESETDCLFSFVQYAQQYTFTAAVKGADERVRLWVDNHLLVDQWASLDRFSTGSGDDLNWNVLPVQFTFPTRKALYHIKMDYKEGSGDHGIRLYWETAFVAHTVSKVPVESHRLFRAYHMEGSPFTLSTHPGFASGTTTLVTGNDDIGHKLL